MCGFDFSQNYLAFFYIWLQCSNFVFAIWWSASGIWLDIIFFFTNIKAIRVTVFMKHVTWTFASYFHIVRGGSLLVKLSVLFSLFEVFSVSPNVSEFKWMIFWCSVCMLLISFTLLELFCAFLKTVCLCFECLSVRLDIEDCLITGCCLCRRWPCIYLKHSRALLQQLKEY